jgi:hypothetical protein
MVRKPVVLVGCLDDAVALERADDDTTTYPPAPHLPECALYAGPGSLAGAVPSDARLETMVDGGGDEHKTVSNGTACGRNIVTV